TDGEHNQPGDPIAEAEAARNAGTEIFAIAIGEGPKLAQLNGIVSPPADGHTVSVDDFDGLVAVLAPLVAVVCPPTPTLPPTAAPAPPGDTPTDTPQGDGSVPPGSLPGPDDSDSAGPVDETLGVTRLPVVGAGLPPELEHRGGDLLAQALGGLGGALILLVATYWVARWRVRR
ncbi:MAG: VWA domain-containing protein, partial [Chloroflexi bacterium]|nr:VWA domain-containing protein [Chloroflexota bacterium]